MNKLIDFSMACIIAYCLSGCTRQAGHVEGPSREDYRNITAYASRLREPIELIDRNLDGKIDAIVDSHRVLAIDTAVNPYDLEGNYEGRMMQRWTVPLDSSTISLANKIQELESELAFKLDSVIYANERRR